MGANNERQIDFTVWGGEPREISVKYCAFMKSGELDERVERSR